MRIINITAGPMYCTYARQLAGGTILQSGQHSSELGLMMVHTQLLQKDLKAGKIALRLSEEDHAFIANLLAYDRREIKIARPLRKEKPQAIKQTAPPAQLIPNLSQNEDKLNDITTFMGGIKLPNNPMKGKSVGLVQPGGKPLQTITVGDGPALPDYGRPSSLADVQAANAANKQR